MSRVFRFTLLSMLILFSFACGLITNPLNQAKGLASTAEALATSMPVSTLEALPSSMPLSTLEALPSSMPALGQYLNPTGKPVSNWNNIPIMTQATAGQEFNKNTYSFKANATATDVQTFYTAQLKALGWSSSFSAQGGGKGGVMLFTKGTTVLTVTITPNNDSVVVILVLE
ncbi:MAG TPA: hypothetical protein VLX61_15575 [Anaerolineales bacterium]|nr:hypothetical protein [Anaerolineales bacterium]